jgi:predicted esterase
LLLAVLALAGCPDDSSGADTETDTADAGSGGTGGVSGDSVSPTSGDPATTADPTASGGSTTNATGAETTDDPTAASETGDTTGPRPDPTDPVIPELQGDCPEFVLGTVENPAQLEFPVGNGSREAMVYFDPAQGGGGPLVFFFHGGGGSPEDAVATATDDLILDVMDRGGMVIAPISHPSANLEWFLASGSSQPDVVMMDSMVACADAGPGIDTHRIHGIGFSSGGLHVAITSILRSSYMASTVVYSGGIYTGFTPDNPDATASALIFHGGEADNVGGLAFEQSSIRYADALTDRGGYALLCNHGTGHGYPDNVPGEWRRTDAYNFLLDHPFGVTPHPYPDGGLPEWVPPYCDG